MFNHCLMRVLRSGWPLLAGACGLTLCLGACAEKKDVLTAPRALVAPYDTSRGEVLWAVAPLINESGTTTPRLDAITDKLVAAVEETQGVQAVPLNRTLEAMRSLKLAQIATPGEARRLAQAMGVDGVLVGTLTAYDPYTPVIGLKIALFSSPVRRPGETAGVDARALQNAATDTTAGLRWSDRPVVVVSENLDAKNNQVLMDLKTFADGRQNGPTATGWRRYLASADLYAEFAAYHAVDALLRQEWIRAGRAAATETRP